MSGTRFAALCLACAVAVGAALVGPLAEPGSASTLGPSNAAWVSYYANPTSMGTWQGFCTAGGASDLANADGVPACGPTGSATIYVPGALGPPWTPLAGPIVGFQCVELAERYLYVKVGWPGLNQTNGGRVVARYAEAHHLTPVVNGTGKAPAVGDVMSFSGDATFDAAGGAGHVAIVVAAPIGTSGDGTVTVVGENQNWVSSKDHTLTAGRMVMNVHGWKIVSFDGDDPHIEWLHPVAAPKFAAASPPKTAKVATAYSYQFAASGAPTPTFSRASGSLPPGLSLNSLGKLTGTPTTPGAFTYTVKASNSLGSATTPTLTVTVAIGTTALAAGGFHTCARLSSGGVKCWGDNNEGQVGDGTTIDRGTPTAVAGLSGAIAVAAGGFHTCALLATHVVKCWGYNAQGELGDGTTTGPQHCNGNPCSTTPVSVTGLSGVIAITAGFDDSCALLANGTVKCWGENGYGDLGDGTTTVRDTPVKVTSLSDTIEVVASVDGHNTCALLATRAVKCWGDNYFGQLGVGNSSGPQHCYTLACSTTPVMVTALSGVKAIGVGEDHTCALLTAGTVKCWGSNSGYGQLGIGHLGGPEYCAGGDVSCSTTPVAVMDLSGVTAIAAGQYNACALLAARTAKCWGDNELGQGGDGTTSDRYSPMSVAGLISTTDMTAGGTHTCALLVAGTVKCWGDNAGGDVGDGTTITRDTPTAVKGLTGVG